jgi:processing peptidase subunit alpha
MVNEPLFDRNEIKSTQESMLWEIENRKFNTDETLPEVLHSIAYGNTENAHVNTLGRPLYHSEESLLRLNSDILRDFHSTWFTPNRMVIAGVGVDHYEFLDLARKSFGSVQSPSKEILGKQVTAPLKYTGGTLITDTSSHPPHPNPENMLLTHLHIGFEAFSASDPDIYALATFVSLMGGGGSFSAGGPGKGMYTRVYRTVLNRFGWVESCHAVHHPYSDSSLFVIKIAVPPSSHSHKHAIDVVCNQLVGMAEKIEEEELSRAKNQLKSSLLMSLESRLTESEDIGRQIITFNKRLDVVDVCKRIDSLTIEDLKRVARRVIFASDESSPLNFNDSSSVPWNRTGKGNASVLVWGNLETNDYLYNISDRMRQWGIRTDQPQKVEIKKSWMDRLKSF